MKAKGTQFFHGTGGALQGDTVRPHDPKMKIRPDSTPTPENTLAFATTSSDEAHAYAGMRASAEGRLFGSV